MEATPAWRPLGELIVERGLISQEDLEDALLEQRITNKRLGSILIDKGIVTAKQLTDSLVDQIGVEELLDEIDHSENGDADDDTEEAPNESASSLHRFRPRLHIDLPASRLAKPFTRIGAKRSPLGHRRQDGPIGPFAPLNTPVEEEPEESFETAVLELVEYDRVPEPEPEQEAAPEPEADPEPEIEAEAEPDVDDEAEVEDEATEPEQALAGPHGWLAEARSALDEAEADVKRLDQFGIARTVELEDVRRKLAEQEAATARHAEAQTRAEEEIDRLHALIDERDSGLTAMEGTVEELREIVSATETELHKARGDFEQASAELRTARSESASLTTKIAEIQGTLKATKAELEAATGESERRGTRISELEAQAAELAENLSATDETLGIEMHAREQAQRESKRLHEELDERDARVAKLAGQVEALEAELEVVVAEREQSQRKLRSRERRMTKLETTLAELRTEQETASAAPVAEPVEADEPEAKEPEAVAVAEPETKPEPEQKPEQKPKANGKAKAKPARAADPAPEAKQVEGFLYFVPREGDGYELVEQPGSAPAVGDTIDLDGKSFQVTRHTRSPLPFDRRTCVYLRLS